MRVAVVTTALVMVAVGIDAHELQHANDPRVFSRWDQAALAFLILLGVLYLAGSKNLSARGARPLRLNQAAFTCGWLALVAAILPWFDAAAIERFSVHMAQHELMMLVGAPLIMAGRPLSTFLWGLPERWRRRVAMPLQYETVAGGIRILTAPVAAWALHGLVIWVWHLPALYELAVRSEAAHAAQHAMFVGTSILFWWGLLYGRYGRAGYGAAVFYVFTTAVHTGILGALLTFARAPLYSVYVNVAGTSSQDAVADQQIAGLVMWIPAGMVLTMIGIALFAAWLGEAERRGRVGACR